MIFDFLNFNSLPYASSIVFDCGMTFHVFNIDTMTRPFLNLYHGKGMDMTIANPTFYIQCMQQTTSIRHITPLIMVSKQTRGES
jgi:hypothetical protein